MASTANPANIRTAADVLRRGGLVAFPTETVYGLGADATNAGAVARIFEIKGRPAFNPLICHVGFVSQASKLAEFSDLTATLASEFWPGPMTLVLPKSDDCPVATLATAGLNTIAIRVPANEIAHELLATVGKPVAAPSANVSGQISPSMAEHVYASFGDKVDYLLDGGATEIGLESTILGVTGDLVHLLRPGGLTVEDIKKRTGIAVRIADPDPDQPLAPGQLESHYAPRAALRLEADEVETGEALLGFGPDLPVGFETASQFLNLSEGADLREAAANLFDFIHRLDNSGVETIAVVPIPEKGLGLAINDRLRRAAAPR